jgi:hypothetical protein
MGFKTRLINIYQPQTNWGPNPQAFSRIAKIDVTVEATVQGSHDPFDRGMPRELCLNSLFFDGEMMNHFWLIFGEIHL